MGNLFVEMIAVAFLSWGWMWRPPFEEFQREDPGKWGWQAPKSAQEEVREDDPEGETWSRGLFSAYVVGGLDCMDDGSYDQYLECAADDSADGVEPEIQVKSDGFPVIYLKFMGLDLTDYIRTGTTGRSYDHKAFCSDQFYMEYPWDWYVGSTDACPLTFVPEWEHDASGDSIRDWVDYFDENLEGDVREVQAYIEGGGINRCLEEVIGKPVTEEYDLVLRESDSDWLLIYDLEKEGKEAAEVVVWCNLGKFSVRSREVELTVGPEGDYGRILVFQEWKDYDFSSQEAIKEYMESGDFLYRLLGKALEEDVEEEIMSLNFRSHTTPYHNFFCVDVGICDKDRPERLLRQAFVYIPVTRPDQSNWVVAFESFPGARQDGVGSRRMRERVISTFVVLPYYHRVRAGENLSLIAEAYGEDPDLAYEIAAWGPNHIRQPDLIWPGQEIQIPLRVLFRRIHH